jgi:hypothetical protein
MPSDIANFRSRSTHPPQEENMKPKSFAATLVDHARRNRSIAGLALCAAAAMPAQAALHDRGGGLIYDDHFDITWTQDVSILKSSMHLTATDWQTSVTAASQFVFHDPVRRRDTSGWRLPSLVDLGDPGCVWAFGGTECGFNVLTEHSELAHLFYVDLGNLAGWTEDGQQRAGVSGVDWGLVNTGPFANMQNYVYWTGVRFPAPNLPDYAWYFNTTGGNQDAYPMSLNWVAWAVHDGDVAAVPEPGQWALMLAGLAIVARTVRRRR